ncbi:hypothetical protein ACH4MO_36845 [Streptomyces globisporus]|uniref:hypothetical protein n=1 Tax=Streptomyces globisporus TaxID=1908 RepID=UPI0037B97625
MTLRRDGCVRRALPAPGAWRGGSSYDGTVKDGYRVYGGTIPVLVTTLAQLRLRGPQDALDNPEDVRGYRHREEQRRTERDTQRERERQKQQEAESRREAAAWPCPTCGRKVYPDDDGETPLPGSDCTFCTSTKKRE